MKIIKLSNQLQVEKIITYLSSKDAFDFELSPGTLSSKLRQHVERGLKDPNCAYWLIEDEIGNLIGTVGVMENEYKHGGYFLDYFSVRPSLRGNGYGKQLFETALEFVKNKQARYMTIETGDDPTTQTARRFYERNGFKQVSHFPNFY